MAPEQKNRPTGDLLRRRDQALLAGVVLLSLLMMGGYWVTQVVISKRVVDIDHAPAPGIAYQVDVNRADWTEFLQLPDIGEAIARQIVAYRQAHGPFKDIGDLRRVRGIGKKRFEDIRPFLRPIAPPDPEKLPSI